MEKNNYFLFKFVGGGVYPKCEIVGGGCFFNLNLLVVHLNFMGVLPPGDTFFWNSPQVMLSFCRTVYIYTLYAS